MLKRLTYSIATCFCICSAQAATVTLPSQVDPGRIEDQFGQPADSADSHQLRAKPTVNFDAPTGSEQVSLTLKAIKIEGMTAYNESEISSYYEALIGKTVTLADIYKATQQITLHYREDGYLLSKAVLPAQKISDGNVTIRIVEGYIGDVIVQGDILAPNIIQGILTPITAEKPINVGTIERSILLLNDLPGVVAKGILSSPKTSAKKEGEVALVVSIENQDFINNVNVSNHGSRFLGPYQSGVRLGANSLLAPYQQSVIGGYVSLPFDELQYVYGSHSIPLNHDGLELRITGSLSYSEPGSTIERNDVEGSSYSLAANLKYPWLRSRQHNIYLNGSFEWKHSETDILSTELFDDELRVLRAGVSYDGADGLDGTNLASIEVSQGLNILGASDSGDLNLSRAQGDGRFTKLNGSLARVQRINNDFNIYGALSGQWANQALLSSEEFGFGGRQFGRAYDSSEITGDHGVAALIELRYTGLPIFSSISAQPYAFYDAGKVWNEDTGGTNISGTSTGTGLRFNYDDVLSGDLSVAVPLTLPAAASHSSNKKDPRAFFSINMRF